MAEKREWVFSTIGPLSEKHYKARLLVNAGPDYLECVQKQWNEMTDAAIGIERKMFAAQYLARAQQEDKSLWLDADNISAKRLQVALRTLHAVLITEPAED